LTAKYLGEVSHESVFNVVHGLGVHEGLGLPHELSHILVNSELLALVGDVGLEEDDVKHGLLFLS
jgi:hypothetical protein